LSLDKALASVVVDPDVALRISRTDHLFVVFIIPLYLHFTYTFLGITTRKWLLGLAYAFSGCLSILSQGDHYISGEQQYFFGYYVQGGPLLYVFGTATITNTLYCLYLLFGRVGQEKDPHRRNKIKYIILGLGMGVFMTHFDLLPLTGVGTYPLGNLAFIPLLLLAFAVLKHDLLDIGVVVQKSLVYSLLTGLLTGSYALMIISFHQLFKGVGRETSIYFLVLFFLMIVFVFDPLKKRVQVIIDRILFRGKYDYQKTVAALSDAMASMLNLDEIVEKVLRTLTGVMYLNGGFVMLLDERERRLKVHSQMGNGLILKAMSIKKSSPLIREIGRRKREVTLYNVEEWASACEDGAQLQEDFGMLGGTVIIPMIFKGEINGLLVLGNKAPAGLFTPEDLELLRTLANQCAVSIENAKAYQVIESLKNNLEEVVERRTQQLTRALEEKERTQDLLIRSESLAAVGALVAGVAHELNNPIASVSSLVQSAVETLETTSGEPPETKPEEKAETVIELINDLKFSLKELDRAASIVASLLGISRHTHEGSETVALNDVCKDALKVLHNQHKGTGIQILEAYAETLPEIRGNASSLAQVCLNVIGNALQVVDSLGGRIVVSTDYDPYRRMVVFECEDNGPGITEGVIKDIFKPFFTTKEVGKGTGLGLYISYEIVCRHNGTIFAGNNSLGGATFTVELPVAG
jgi:signal transduction histidine kinase